MKDRSTKKTCWRLGKRSSSFRLLPKFIDETKVAAIITMAIGSKVLAIILKKIKTIWGIAICIFLMRS